MNEFKLLLAGTALGLASGLVAAQAQSGGGTTPQEQGEGAAPAASGTNPGQPVETAAPNAPDQQPAFAGQTRAPQPAEMPAVAVEVVADDLPQLWAMEFLPDGDMLVTAKSGEMYIISVEGALSAPIEGVPAVDSAGQGGLLDVALAPDFETSKRIFFSFSEPRDGGNGTSVASAVLAVDGGKLRLDDVKIIFRQMPTYDGDKHFGSRLVFAEKGDLFVTVGERSDRQTRVQAQDLSSGLGKIFRITADGAPAEGNPLIGRDGALPEIWSYGHRNLQSAALDGQGRLWTVEHGPRGGDELTMPQAGLNYGWPVITYGIEYGGGRVGEGRTQAEGMEQPVYYWDPVIGPSGMAFYTGDEFPEWKNAFLVGGLVSTGLVVLHLDGDRVAFEERVPLQARIRDVRVGPDGAVYVVTERRGSGSQILRLTKDG